MLTFSIVITVVVVGGYLLRRNFRRMFYVLWTGDEHPDWDVLEKKWYGEEKGEKERL